MVLQTSAPVQNPYKDRHWHAVPRVRLCFSAGRAQGPTETRSYFAYFTYSSCFDLFITSAWVDQCQSAIVYERCEQAQVLYVIPVSSILGHLPLVPVGATGTIPFAMRRESADFPGAFCDKSANSGDGCRWWYVNAGPWDGGPSSSGNKRWKPGARLFPLWICTICRICILQYAEYAQYASMKMCRICMIICKITCMQYAK